MDSLSGSPRKKRILIFSTAYAPFVGGAEVAVKEITDRLPGYEFVMITAKMRSDLPAVEKIGNIEVHRVGKGNRWDKFRLIFSGWKTARALGRFDIVWSIMASYAGFAALAFKTRNKKVPFLLTLQEGDSKAHIYSRVWFVWPFFKQIFTRADRIQAISSYLADWAKDMGATCSIDVVPNGINMDYRLETTDGRPESIKRVVSVSRLVKKNGIEDLIKAIKILENQGTKVVLEIVGDGELREELEKRVKDLGITGRVVFAGNVPYKEVYHRLRQADVFVRPSLSEGLGNAFLEAMAMGVPVIGTGVGGIPDFLKDGETGLFCNVHDPKDIAEKVKKILDNPELAEILSTNGRTLVEEKYSWDLIAENMNKIFQSL